MILRQSEQLVTEARNLLDSIKGGAIRTMQNSFDTAMSGFTHTLIRNYRVIKAKMNTVTKAVMEVINGVNVYHVAGKRCTPSNIQLLMVVTRKVRI
ncbi:hypothetical protein O9929_01435 [Vibrio lentus]|nr:hypothetical protein [Vibrio lentus]